MGLRVIVTCPSCRAKYKLKKEIDPRGAKISCPSCQHKFRVYPGNQADTSKPAPRPASGFAELPPDEATLILRADDVAELSKAIAAFSANATAKPVQATGPIEVLGAKPPPEKIEKVEKIDKPETAAQVEAPPAPPPSAPSPPTPAAPAPAKELSKPPILQFAAALLLLVGLLGAVFWMS